MVRNHSASSKINFEKPISPNIERNHKEKSKLILRLQENNNNKTNNNKSIIKRINPQSDLSLPPNETEKIRVKQGFKESIDLLNCKIQLKEGFGEERSIEKSFCYDYEELYEKYEEEKNKERMNKKSRYIFKITKIIAILIKINLDFQICKFSRILEAIKENDTFRKNEDAMNEKNEFLNLLTELKPILFENIYKKFENSQINKSTKHYGNISEINWSKLDYGFFFSFKYFSKLNYL